MGRSDDGEFELILGNKQLLSVFFVVVMLLGVFFAMGYIVGKNAAPENAIAKNSSGRIEIDPRTPGGSVTPPAESRPVETPKPAREEPRPEPVAKEPEKPKPAPEPKEVKPREAPPTEAKKAEPKKAEPRKEPAPEPTPARGASEPVSGKNYLQVVASTRPDCEIIIDVLRRKGFSAVIAPGPSDKLFRVLVGPLADPASIAKTRSDLEGAGFQKPYLRKF